MPTNEETEGLIQVYTGDGKGKTTAALGLALRALGHGYKIYIGQFMKGQAYGELRAAKQFAGQLVIEQYGQPSFVHVKNPSEKDVQLAQQGLQKIKAAIDSRNYRIVVMDEINVAIYFRLISIDDVLHILQNKPAEVEIICTGRKAPKELIEIADLVTEMREIKHYFNAGIPARKGFET
ncbi:MAG TPA: cob(I)yrinic acid a,c-diamide adenosyltransferase [Bacteroidetes bacterium]|nr:cob(I)yrinic acid a,c-diamide adenosyltransferase [Bacteroidota bacterium]